MAVAALTALAKLRLPIGGCAFYPAAPLLLHAGRAWRADGNSPLLIEPRGATLLFSDYEPYGHTLRRQTGLKKPANLENLGPPQPIRYRNDPAPQVGKWIEALWRAPDGRLFGWFHAEEPAPHSPLFVPYIGEAVSDDDGLTWDLRGALLRSPADQIDTSYANGFFAGGFGDLSVLPDRDGKYLYLGFTSYLADERHQGIAFARLPLPRPADAHAGLEIWRDGRWQPHAPLWPSSLWPSPLWPMRRGWRHADPDGYWGPALHYNRALKAYVMLLNHTANGSANLLQEGICMSINADLSNPAGWSEPQKLVQGGAWYPQCLGNAIGDGDTQAGGETRFFLAGFSAWTLRFSSEVPAGPDQPLVLGKADFPRLFGPKLRSPW